MKCEWEVVRLGDYIESCLGKMLDAKKNKGVFHPYLGNSNVRWGRFELSELAQMKFEQDEEKRYGIQSGDLIVCEGGEPGRCAIWCEELPDMKIQKALHRIRTKEGLDNYYLYYWFLMAGWYGWLEPYFTGTTIKHLTGKALVELRIPLPKITIQRTIASILSCLDAKIANNAKINHHLEQIAQAIFKNWFVDFEPWGGVMPDDWREIPLGEVMEMSTKALNPQSCPDMILEHYSIPAFDETCLPVFEIASEIKSNKYIVDKNCFLISKLNPTTKRIWRPYCISKNAVCSTEFIVYRAKNPAYKDFYYSVIDSPAFTDFLLSHVTGSTGSRQRAIPNETLSFSVIVPPNNIVEDFCDMVTAIYSQFEQNYLENWRLRQTRDAILPRLMSGKFDLDTTRKILQTE